MTTSNPCPSCGALLLPGAVFCPGCGKTSGTVAAAPKPKFCSGCGTEVRPDATFCATCGATVNAPPPAAVAAPLAPMAPIVVHYPMAPPPKKKKMQPVAAIFLVLVMGAAIFTFLLAMTHLGLNPLSSGNYSGSAGTPAYDPTLNYATTFTTDYNTMIKTDKIEVGQENSRDAATSIAGIDARINLHRTFDQQVAAIPWPVNMADQQKQVLDSDSAFENSLSQLRNNRNNIANYNAVLAANLPLYAAFEAAVMAGGN
jgi:hypothetical protein